MGHTGGAASGTDCRADTRRMTGVSWRDLEPAGGVWGRPEDLTRTVWHHGHVQRQLGLLVSNFDDLDRPNGTLGLLAVRCEGHTPDTEQPLTLAIADDTLVDSYSDRDVRWTD